MIDFFEFSNEMLCVADGRGYFTRVNQAWTKTLGWSAEELTSRPYLEFVHPDDQRATIREAGALLNGRETVQFENRYRCRDGTYKWLAWRVVPELTSGLLIATARDVTAQKLQTEALREAEKRFRTLADYAPVGIAQADAAGSIFYVNPKWCDLAGVRPEEALGFAWKDFVHPEDLPGLLNEWQGCLRERRDMPPYEFRFLHRNGQVRWASSSVALLKGADDEIEGQIASVQDIHYRKTAEQHFRAIYEQAPVGIGIVDSRSGRFLQINPRYEAIIGRSQAEMKQLNFQRITYPEDLQADLDQMDALLSGRIRFFRMEKRLIRGDGSTIWVSLTVVPMWQADELPTYHMAIIDDITRRKAAEDELRAKESQLRSVLDNSPAVVYLKDLEGRYLLVNRRHELLFPGSGTSVIGKTDLDWFPREFAQMYMASDAEVLKTGAPYYAEEVGLHDDGPHTYRSVKFPVIDAAGKMIAIGGISTDISDLREAHDALKIKEALLRNLIEIQENEKQFLCHEFHDGLIQYAVGAKLSLEAYRQSPGHAADAAPIDAAIDNLRKGVEDGRRVIRGIRTAVLDDSDVEAAVNDLVEQYVHSGMHVTFRCDPTIGRLPESVQTTIYRVVQEALNNAKKYSGTDVVRIELAKAAAELQLEVRDFGCGFDVAAARKKGFGLLGMNERVRLLGGECSIESKIDEGTRIAVRIPLPSGTNGDEA